MLPVLEPLEDEIFSCWLVRNALANGCDPISYTGSIWQDWRFWTLDIDRRLSNKKRRIIEEAIGQLPSSFASLFLKTNIQRMSSSKLSYKSAWPWLVPLSIRNRSYGKGVQYCPYCFNEDTHPYIRKHWRYAWYTLCSVHRTFLETSCLHCGANFEIQKLQANHSSIKYCWNCHSDISKKEITLEATNEESFQDHLKIVSSNFSEKDSIDRFEFTYYLTVLIRYGIKLKNTNQGIARLLDHYDIEVNESLKDDYKARFEMLSPKTRFQILEKSKAIYNDNQEGLLNAIELLGIKPSTLRSLVLESRLPVLLKKSWPKSVTKKRLKTRKISTRLKHPSVNSVKNKHSILELRTIEKLRNRNS